MKTIKSLLALAPLLLSASPASAVGSLTYKVHDTATIDSQVAKYAPRVFFNMAVSGSGKKVAVAASGLQVFEVSQNKFNSQSLTADAVGTVQSLNFLKDEDLLWTIAPGPNAFVWNVNQQTPSAIARTDADVEISDDSKVILNHYHEGAHAGVTEIRGTTPITRGYDQHVKNIFADIALLDNQSAVKASTRPLYDDSFTNRLALLLNVQVLDLDLKSLGSKEFQISTIPKSIDECGSLNGCNAAIRFISISKKAGYAAIGVQFMNETNNIRGPLVTNGAVIFVSLGSKSVTKKIAELKCASPKTGSFTNKDKNFVALCNNSLSAYTVSGNSITSAGQAKLAYASGAVIAKISENGVVITHDNNTNIPSLGIYRVQINGIQKVGEAKTTAQTFSSFDLSNSGLNLVTVDKESTVAVYQLSSSGLVSQGSEAFDSVTQANFAGDDSKIVLVNRKSELKLIELVK